VTFLLLPVAFAQATDDPDADGANALQSLAEAFKDGRTVEQIKKDNVLIRAAARGNLEGVRKALQDGALINSRYVDSRAFLDEGQSGFTALMFAIRNKRMDVIKMLIEKKADLEVRHYTEGYTAMYLAVAEDEKEIIELLVKAGAKQDPGKIRLAREMIAAACKGFKDGPHEPFPPAPGGPTGDTLKYPDIAAVLKRGGDVNAADPMGYTALMYAANLGLVGNVKTLLARGADASRKSLTGETALTLAAEDNPDFHAAERREVVRILKEHLKRR
jgi:ankyrin repeat protein